MVILFLLHSNIRLSYNKLQRFRTLEFNWRWSKKIMEIVADCKKQIKKLKRTRRKRDKAF